MIDLIKNSNVMRLKENQTDLCYPVIEELCKKFCIEMLPAKRRQSWHSDDLKGFMIPN